MKLFKAKSIILGVLMASSVIGAAALEIYLDYRDTETRAYKASSDVTLVVEQQMKDTVRSVENLIDTNAKTIIEAGNLKVVNNKKYFYELKSDCISIQGCEVVAIADPNGDLVLDTAYESSIDKSFINISDRQYFKKSIEEKKLFIGPAIVSRLPNHQILFNIAKPVFDKNGKLLAVITMGIKTSHLTGFYSLLGFGFSPTIAVYKKNGDMVSRNPGMEEYVGKSNAHSDIFKKHLKNSTFGNYVSHSQIDKKVRLAAYRSIPELDLVIFAGVETPVAFNQWKIRTIRVASIVGILLIITLSTFYWAYLSGLENKELQIKNEKLDELSNIDELTGIGNRRIFETTLKQEWSRYKRNKVNLTVMLIDVDYFKPYNDNYGHPEGDKTLHKVAQALQECVHRPTDLVARYGGEEFVVILNTDEAGARLIAESIREKIESLRITHEFSQVSNLLTVSIGLASTSNTNAKNPEVLVQEADIALYKAKNEGRNRISIFKPNDIADKKNS